MSSALGYIGNAALLHFDKAFRNKPILELVADGNTYKQYVSSFIEQNSGRVNKILGAIQNNNLYDKLNLLPELISKNAFDFSRTTTIKAAIRSMFSNRSNLKSTLIDIMGKNGVKISKSQAAAYSLGKSIGQKFAPAVKAIKNAKKPDQGGNVV
jgi:hypothetical protein